MITEQLPIADDERVSIDQISKLPTMKQLGIILTENGNRIFI